MTRTIAMVIVMAFALGFVGCRACMSPYEHCQPTFIPERGDQCMGELYRCGSILGGMERSSNANGECESCGGGSTEYYTANGYVGEGSQVASQNVSQAVAQVEPLENAASSARYASPASYVAPAAGASLQGNDFSLSNDYEEY